MQKDKATGRENLKNKIKKVKIKTVVYAFLIFLLVFFLGMMFLAYGTNTKIGKKIVGEISRIVPFPAVIINYTQIISLGEVQKNLASVKSFYENQDFSSSGLRVDFSTDAGKKRLKIKEKEVLNKMLEDRIIINLAEKRGILVTKDELNLSIEKKIKEYGGKREDTEKTLQKLYGWSFSDFENKIVLPSLYKEKLKKAITPEIADVAKAREKIALADKELKSGKDFSEVAVKYSEGFYAKDGGQIGWVSKKQLLPDLQAILFPENGNPKTDQVVESLLGFHIIEIEETKAKSTANPESMLKIRQIFVGKPTFASWLNQQMKSAVVFVPLSDYYWDKNSATIEFKDKDMIKFEKDNIQNPSGDISIMK
jgi:parvulin-like peptidyl-prolyl isomerase